MTLLSDLVPQTEEGSVYAVGCPLAMPWVYGIRKFYAPTTRQIYVMFGPTRQ